MGKLLALFICLCLPFSAAQAKTYFQGDPDQKRIAITIDDCRRPDVMEDMLDLFQAEGIHVTFYPIGIAIHEKDADLWRRVLADGHEIGNHTYGHLSLPICSPGQVERQLSRMETALDKALGFHYEVMTMRPPFGKYKHRNTMTKISNAGYDKVILWTVSQTDAKTVLRQISNGSVCLFHTNPKDYRCLQVIIPALKAEGYEMVTVSELFGFTDKPDEPSQTAEPALIMD